MADLPQDSNGDSGRTPRWVYVFGIIAILLVVSFLIVHLTVGGLGSHGP